MDLVDMLFFVTDVAPATRASLVKTCRRTSICSMVPAAAKIKTKSVFVVGMQFLGCTICRSWHVV